MRPAAPLPMRAALMPEEVPCGGCNGRGTVTRPVARTDRNGNTTVSEETVTCAGCYGKGRVTR